MNQKRVILWLACAAIFFEAFDVSIVNLSLQAIAGDLHISVAQAQWVQTIYVVAFGSFLLLGGRLCDHWGSKRIYRAGMLLFGVASALAFVTHIFPLLLVIRGAQGLGAALAMPAGISLLTHYFEEGRERNAAFGTFGSFAAIGFALGLALGGIITTYYNWHWIFSINVPFFAVILYLSKRIPAQNKTVSSSPNITTSAWLVINLLILCFAIHELPALGFIGVLLIVIACASFFIMVHFDQRLTNPFFSAGAFKGNGRKAQVSSMLLGAVFLSYVFVTTLVLVNVFGLNGKTSGLLLFPYSIASALVSRYILPRWMHRMGVRNTARVSMLMMFGGAVFLGFGIYFEFLWLVCVSLLLVNTFCIAIAYPSLTILALDGVTPGNHGIAAGLQSSLYSIGTSIGLSLTALCLQLDFNGNRFILLIVPCVLISVLSMVATVILNDTVKKG